MNKKVLLMSLMMSALCVFVFAQDEEEIQEQPAVESCMVSFCDGCDKK